MSRVARVVRTVRIAPAADALMCRIAKRRGMTISEARREAFAEWTTKYRRPEDATPPPPAAERDPDPSGE